MSLNFIEINHLPSTGQLRDSAYLIPFRGMIVVEMERWEEVVRRCDTL